MKKVLTLFLLVCLIGCFSCACSSSGTPSDDSADNNTSVNVVEEDDELTEEECEAIVVNALYDEISSKYDTADAGSCRYKINSTEEKGDYTYVYGTVTLYDKYGQLTTGWVDGSGSYNRSFEVKISSSGSAVSCDID